MGRGGVKTQKYSVSGVALPFPRCCQADMARSEGLIFSNATFSLRFHTASVDLGRSYLSIPCFVFRVLELPQVDVGSSR